MYTPSTGILHTRSGAHPLALRVAGSFWSRLRGLMLAPPLLPAQGMLITRCASVHGAFLRAPLDIVYLDRGGAVVQCAPGLRPWRASYARLGGRAAHALELAAGAIAALHIRPGDRLEHARLTRPAPVRAPLRRSPPRPGKAQRGSAMVEFTLVAPIITLLGLAIVQYAMVFFARSQVNYAAFMAAREGATANASLNSVYTAYLQALVPMYGGGQAPAELAASLARATADSGANGVGNVQIELLNPTRESFTDWNDAALQARLHTGSRRVIPNSGQMFKDQHVGAASGQTIQDANLIKLRITHGYLPKVPLIKHLYGAYLTWLDPHTEPFRTKLLEGGRIPVVTHVTLHMQSDAIEPESPVSSPGPGNGGVATNPGTPPLPGKAPPDCNNLTCTNPPTTPTEPPVCNPFTDPAHCAPNPCDVMCCKPG